MERQKTKNSGLLALTALIWGVAFVAQSVGMDYVGPFTFNAVRSLIGGLALLPCILWQDRSKRRPAQETSPKTLWLGGVLCGLALCAASSLQQIGIAYTTVGKAGFITALYIVIVPVLGVFMKKKTGVLLWISVALASTGLYFLCITENLSIGRGDVYVLACAVIFSFHILLVDYFSPRTDGVRLSCIQFFVCGLTALIPALLQERPQVTAVLAAWAPILYAGVLSCGVGYTLQVIGQKGLDPTVASLILSLESVFSVLAGWLLLGQSLSGREIGGCVLMAAAIVLAQIKPAVHENVT
ncbi:MAG: DMT family transporter [Lachnospiraceae bacterium]|nr:DMT family transporter [Lachnospiraceae bacterium]